MAKKGKVTLSLDSSTYDQFKQYCHDRAIMLSKKIENWIKLELQGKLNISFKAKAKPKNKKVTLSIDTSIYKKFQEYCDENAIMLSKKVEIWIRYELSRGEK